MDAGELAELFNAFATTLSAAAELFAKDADLDRNDALGEIDLGAARQLLALARQQAVEIVEGSPGVAFAQGGPGLGLRKIAVLLVAKDIEIYEAFVPTLGRLVDEASSLPAGARRGREVESFERALSAAILRTQQKASGPGGR